MDHSWCPVCDCHVFASDNLYCSEACQRKDATSVFINDSKEKFYEFPRCSSQKPFQSPYASPNSSPMNSPLLHPIKDYFGTRDYYSKDYDLSTSPSTYLLNSELIPRRKPLRKKSSFTENARQFFFNTFYDPSWWGRFPLFNFGRNKYELWFSLRWSVKENGSIRWFWNLVLQIVSRFLILEQTDCFGNHFFILS